MKKLILFTLFFSFFSLKAQDPIFTSGFTNSYFYNPAFQGLKNSFSATLAYRQIYPGLSNFSNYGVNLNKLILNPKIGIGLTALKFYEGDGSYNTSLISFSFNKLLMITSNIKISLGLNAGYLSRKLDLSDKIFSNQIDPVLGINTASVSVADNTERTDNVNFAAGFAMIFNVNESTHLIGLSTNHLNTPDMSLSNSVDYGYPISFLLTYNATFKISSNIRYQIKLQPKAIIMYQKKSLINLIGADISVDRIMAGVHYRFNQPDMMESISYIGVNTGFNFLENKLTFIYSYEVSFSKLSNTGGLHEISLNYKLFNYKKANSCF